jgi:hypothetical protein
MTIGLSQPDENMMTDDSSAYEIDTNPKVTSPTTTLLDLVTSKGTEIVHMKTISKPFDFGMIFGNDRALSEFESTIKE